jgi:hypothetical protein
MSYLFSFLFNLPSLQPALPTVFALLQLCSIPSSLSQLKHSLYLITWHGLREDLGKPTGDYFNSRDLKHHCQEGDAHTFA